MLVELVELVVVVVIAGRRVVLVMKAVIVQ
jgi:hypothetical protein